MSTLSENVSSFESKFVPPVTIESLGDPFDAIKLDIIETEKALDIRKECLSNLLGSLMWEAQDPNSEQVKGLVAKIRLQGEVIDLLEGYKLGLQEVLQKGALRL